MKLDIKKIKVKFTTKLGGEYIKYKPVDLEDLVFYQEDIELESEDGEYSLPYKDYLFSYSLEEIGLTEVYYEE